MRPYTRYTRSGDVNIAYQVTGEGPFDLVLVAGWVSHLEYAWEDPAPARFFERLASYSRLIRFDKRGTGLSDRVPLTQLPTMEQRMDDVRAVFLATFDGPARAVRCALALMESLRPAGIGIRAGVHTGEVEIMGEQIGGLAVHIAARIAALAGSGEVLTSSTVRDLTAGAGLRFHDRGAQALKGVPGEWHLFAATDGG